MRWCFPTNSYWWPSTTDHLMLARPKRQLRDALAPGPDAVKDTIFVHQEMTVLFAQHVQDIRKTFYDGFVLCSSVKADDDRFRPVFVPTTFDRAFAISDWGVPIDIEYPPSFEKIILKTGLYDPASKSWFRILRSDLHP